MDSTTGHAPAFFDRVRGESDAIVGSVGGTAASDNSDSVANVSGAPHREPTRRRVKRLGVEPEVFVANAMIKAKRVNRDRFGKPVRALERAIDGEAAERRTPNARLGRAMIGTDVILVGCALAAGVAAGLPAHEWSHATVLRAAGVEYDVAFFPDRGGSLLGLLASCPWAQVRPLPSAGDPPWVFRVAALAPASLVLPVAALGLTGYVPGSEWPVRTAFAIGWLACAVPSPRDFSVAFYAHDVLAGMSGAGDGDGD